MNGFTYIPQLFPRADQLVLPQRYETEQRYYHRDLGCMLWPVFHRVCADVAFFMTRAPQTVDNIRSYMVFDWEGNHPPPNTEMICGSCRERILKTDLLVEPPPRKRVFSIPMVAPKEN
jgi:hypothetical protein